jgi:hypothetical protein
MRRALIVVVVVLVGGAWFLGFWPQRQKIAALEAELQQVRQRVETAEAQARTGALLGELRNIEEAVVRQNYGDAQQMSLAFFQHVRDEAGRATDPSVRQALEAVAQRKDAVTGALARADASVLAALRETESALRRALGFAVYGPNPAVPGVGLPAPVPAPSAAPAAPPASPFPTPPPSAPLGVPSP